MTETRVKRIINGLLVLCLVAGFLCFALIWLPNQLERAGATPRVKTRRTNISSIIDIASPKIVRDARRMRRKSGLIAEFVPERRPVDPFAPKGPPPRKPRGDEFAAAGGAGIAVDDGGEESDLSFDSRLDAQALPDEGDDPDDLAVGDPYGDYTPEGEQLLPPLGSESPSLTVHPQSSLAAGKPATTDSASGRRKRPWLVTPEGFEADVAFWRDIYSRYDNNFVVLHHPRYLDIVYDVVNLRDIERDPRINKIERGHMRKLRVDAKRERIEDILERLATYPDDSTLSSEEARIKGLFSGVSEANKFKRAVRENGVRAQLGQSDKFIVGLKYSNRYLGEIERIFEAYGLPVELTRLIFVESMFNTRARSSAGASGIWQFMRGTGKLYLRINDIYDERNDPIAATHAAAKLLRHNYQKLGNWPLAINAYNAGRGRLQQAVSQLGTRDIGKIIRNFKHRSYGFASRNFFLEFLAAYEVAEHFERYFGDIDFDKPLRYEEISSNYHISIPNVADLARIPVDEIEEINPALSGRTLSGRKLVPAGTRLRMPEGKGEIFLALSARAQKSRKGPVHHVVQRGETLRSIASIYGVTPSSIMQTNRISRNVRRGQTLKIPIGK